MAGMSQIRHRSSTDENSSTGPLKAFRAALHLTVNSWAYDLSGPAATPMARALY